MNIILIAENNHYRDWNGKTYFDILTHYTENSLNNVHLIFSDKSNYYTKDIIEKLCPHIIIFFETDTLNTLNYFSYVLELNIPIFYCGLDLFRFNDCIHCPNINKCDGIIHFSKSIHFENSYKIVFPNKIFTHFNARFIITQRFKNYNLEKKYDILIYGSRQGKTNIEQHINDKQYKIKYENFYKLELDNTHFFYPLRIKIENLLIKNSHKYRLNILPNQCIFNATNANEDLSKLINESHLTLSCCTRADIVMAKYFEISASYSAILGDIPSDYNDLFKGNIVEVTEWMSDEEILNIIDNALDNKEKLWEMTKRLGDRVHCEYNLDEGTKNMDEVFEKIINPLHEDII